MVTSSQRFQLFVEHPHQPAHTPPPPIRMAIPDHVCFLTAAPGRLPSLADQPAASWADTWVIEPVWFGNEPHLLLLSHGALAPRVNGLPAPPLALLRERDEVLLGNGYSLHVTLYTKPLIGPPPPHVVGKDCPLCRSPFTPEQTTYTCYRCGSVLHHVPDAAADDAATPPCAGGVATCPVCSVAIILQEGLSFQTELA